MSKAYQCDRCGNLFGGSARSEYEHNAHPLKYQADIPEGELCEDCSKKLKEFLDNV